jgi:hypothetical protein
MSGHEKTFQENNSWNSFVLQHKKNFDFLFFLEEVKTHYDELFWGIFGSSIIVYII